MERKVFYYTRFTAMVHGVLWTYVQGVLNIDGYTCEYFKSTLLRDYSYDSVEMEIKDHFEEKGMPDVSPYEITVVRFENNIDNFLTQFASGDN